MLIMILFHLANVQGHQDSIAELHNDFTGPSVPTEPPVSPLDMPRAGTVAPLSSRGQPRLLAGVFCIVIRHPFRNWVIFHRQGLPF